MIKESVTNGHVGAGKSRNHVGGGVNNNGMTVAGRRRTTTVGDNNTQSRSDCIHDANMMMFRYILTDITAESVGKCGKTKVVGDGLGDVVGAGYVDADGDGDADKDAKTEMLELSSSSDNGFYDRDLRFVADLYFDTDGEPIRCHLRKFVRNMLALCKVPDDTAGAGLDFKRRGA